MSFNLIPKKKEKRTLKVRMLEEIINEAPDGSKTVKAVGSIQELDERIAMRWVFSKFAELYEGE